MTGLDAGTTYTLRHERVDQHHSNVAAAWGRLRADGQDWPDEDQWAQLRAADRLDEAEPERRVVADDDGTLRVEVDLPMPAMSLLTLT